MKLERLDFKSVPNPSCKRNCNRDVRHEITSDGLCNETISVIDQLPVRCVGEWAVQKIFHLVQYFGIFSSGMKNSWDGKINYIEICSSTGRCINRTSGEEFNGTAMCVLEHSNFKHLHRAIFIDYNERVVDTLNKRIENSKIDTAIAILGDYNDPAGICEKIIKETDGVGLNLVFIDPTDCSVPFALIAEIKKSLRHVDFIINIAIGTDVNRNIRTTIMSPITHKTVKDKYLKFLGSDAFYQNPKVQKFAKLGDHTKLRVLFRDAYTDSLRQIGYEYFDFKHIENYYDLVFASSHIKGLEFWQKANAIKIDGQRSLF